MKVINIGSLNIDRTYSVKEFVRPKETIKALKYEEHCGGKGLNQTIALRKAGANVYHAGIIGHDGQMLINELKAADASTEYIKMTDGNSGHAMIQVDEKGENNIIIHGGTNDHISKEFITDVLDRFEGKDILLLQNEITNVDVAMRYAKKKGMTIIFNPSPMNDKIFQYPLELVDYFLINELEAAELAGPEKTGVDEILRQLKIKYPKAAFVMTLGGDGVWFCNQERKQFHPSFKVAVADTTGAGDTFCGYFIAGLVDELDVEMNLRRASAAAAIAVSRHGAAQSIPTKEEVETFLNK